MKHCKNLLFMWRQANLLSDWEYFVIIQEIEILFHNIYKEALLTFRNKKLNIGKVFLLFGFLIK